MTKCQNLILLFNMRCRWYELALLNNELNPHLFKTTMIVECHNHCYKNMEKKI